MSITCGARDQDKFELIQFKCVNYHTTQHKSQESLIVLSFTTIFTDFDFFLNLSSFPGVTGDKYRGPY